jgi:1,4-alpha-glucan branching enzyme
VSYHKPHVKKPAEHVFRFDAPDARRVVVTGSFCAWDPDRHVMTRHRDGHWETHIPLAHGRHEYRFVVDGTWVTDPACGETVPTPFGDTNGVVDI